MAFAMAALRVQMRVRQRVFHLEKMMGPSRETVKASAMVRQKG